MKKINICYLVVLAVSSCLSTVAHADGASFDCAKAASSIEKMICSDQELSTLDKSLNTAYRASLNKNQDSNQKQSQLAWLKDRNQCGDRNCAVAAYVARLAEFHRSEEDSKKIPLSRKDAMSLCEKVQVLTMSGEIQRYYLPAEREDGTSKYVGIDLDNDGVADQIQIDSGSLEGELDVKLSGGGGFEHGDGLMVLIGIEGKKYALVTYRDHPNDKPVMITHDLKFLTMSGLPLVCETWFETPFGIGR